jgi:hypothetical protein
MYLRTVSADALTTEQTKYPLEKKVFSSQNYFLSQPNLRHKFSVVDCLILRT